MCTILLGFRVHPRYPLLVAANRDEYYSRVAFPPHVLDARLELVAGVDATASGTWLGMNRWGCVGLTNQPTRLPPDPHWRSRGLLVRDALESTDLSAALDHTRHASHSYAPYNLFACDGERLEVVYARTGELHCEALEPGWHILPNGFVNQPQSHKVETAQAALQALSLEWPPDELAQELQRILADHSLPEKLPLEPSWMDPAVRSAVQALCVHTPVYGTRSFSVLFWTASRDERRYWHGEGAPCTSALETVVLNFET
jgi:uncharacterized protein with NRDE domain